MHMHARGLIAALLLVTARVEAQGLPEPVPASWAVTITTSGGIAGTGKGSLLARSDGSVSCSAPMTCPARLSAAALERIAAAVAAVRAADSDGASRPSFCRDCYVITIRLEQHSAADDTARAVVFRWTEPVGSSLPDDVRAVYAVVQTLNDPER